MAARVRSTFRIYFFIALLASLIGSAVDVTPAYAASIVVNSNQSNIAADGLCTLPEAITVANNDTILIVGAGECPAGSGADTISFAGNYTITGEFPNVTDALTIYGQGATSTIIQANASPNVAGHRVFSAVYADLTLNKLTVRNGDCSGTCNYQSNGGGGGIFVDHGTLTIVDSIISGNSSAGYGGGIRNYLGSATIINSTISDNHANYGGGIFNSGGSSTVTNSTISGNSAANGGGGAYNSSQLDVMNSTIYGNSSYIGGAGLENGGTLTITNSTISGNLDNGPAGGIFNIAPGLVNMYNTTVFNNRADVDLSMEGFGGGGIYNQNTATFNMRNSLVAGNYRSNANKDCDGTLTLYGNNLFGNICTVVTSNGSWTFLNSLSTIGPLQNNGGPTLTHALLPGSNAIDTGDLVKGCVNANSIAITTDQRGIPRPQGARCDIGAYEYVTVTFTDVPFDHWAWRFVESLYKAGVTSGCGSSPMLYCPGTTVTRDQMAVFLLRAKHGSNYSPPAATGVFQDVPTNHWAAPWIERLAAEGITGGCSTTPKLYCPATPVSRDQMAVFLLRAKHGSSYSPPGATGVFQDVAVNHWAAPWIERLAAEGITGGCSTSPMLYCPATPVSRDQMAVFLVRTFNLP